MKRGTVSMAVALLLLAAALAFVAHRRATGASPGDALLRVPSGRRIRVEVLNTTDTRGLARRATLVLRDAGFDVVYFANGNGPGDSTRVLDRSGHPDRARRVAKALGSARVESRPDSSLQLDVTVLLGADWHPPAKPFYP